ncbi:Chromosome partition protein smc [Hibiscus syriacus]|uniref:Chromosome partition protein smc n=1 Tax=Hibiscus syriacus TaxID=106335 RepID=A0A6A3CWT6_HIBSY|nr:Chromosome partition protein smc [Hibiscus syriacus]
MTRFLPLRILEDIVTEHKEKRKESDHENGEEVVDILLDLHENGELEFPLFVDSIKAIILDRTCSVLGVKHRLGNVHEAGIHELKFLKAVIKESLRLHPTVPLVPRECREGCRLDDRFREKSIDFKGTDFRYIPFGAERRICPGISFALSNIELPIAQLLFHFDWKLPNGMKPEDLDENMIVCSTHCLSSS